MEFIYLQKSRKQTKSEKRPKKARVTLNHFWITFDVFKDDRTTSKAFKKGVKLFALSDFWSL